MTATRIDGKQVAAQIIEGLRPDAARLAEALGRTPGLAVILCGDDPASAAYVRNKQKLAAALGITFDLLTPAPSSTTAELLALVAQLNGAPEVDAILVQLPLPSHVDAAAVTEAVAPDKDADGFHPLNLGKLAAGRRPLAVPPTPAGCLELIHGYGVPVAGARAVVVGRSTIVGRPLALLLLLEDATVTVCHSQTQSLAEVCREADILVSAMGRPGFIGADFVKAGACVIDVGTTLVDGKLRGDVDYAGVAPKAGWLSPVPGGVGPMTVAMLMRNTIALAAARMPAQNR